MPQVLLLYIYCLKSTRQKSAAELIEFILDINTDLTEMVLIVQLHHGIEYLENNHLFEKI